VRCALSPLDSRFRGNDTDKSAIGFVLKKCALEPGTASSAGSAIDLMETSSFRSREAVKGRSPPAAARRRASKDARLSTGYERALDRRSASEVLPP
jgi:hypothetical protein